MPIRKIPKNYRSVTGRFQSYKNKCAIGYESTLERDFFCMLEFDNDVVSYEEQPFKLDFAQHKEFKTYTPDCIVKYSSSDRKDTVFEVKSVSEIASKKEYFEERFALIKSTLENEGMGFQVITDVEIRTPAMEIMKFIYGFAHMGEPTLLENIKSAIKQYSPNTVDNLLSALCGSDKYTRATYMPYIYQSIFLGIFHIDMNFMPNLNTTIQRGTI